MIHARIALTLAATVPAALASCSAPTIDVGGHYGQYDLGGELAINDSALGLAASNTVEDLGITDEDDAIGAYARLQFGGPMLYLSALQPEWSGSGTLTAELDDGDVTIPVGTPVNSRVALDVYTGMFYWDLFPTNVAELGLGIGVSAIDYDVTISSSTDTIQGDETLPIPVVGAMASGDLGPIELSGYLAYMNVDIEGDEVTYLDLDVRGTYHLFGGVGDANRLASHLLVGYKLTDLELEYQDGTEFVRAALDVSGPYIGLRISF